MKQRPKAAGEGSLTRANSTAGSQRTTSLVSSTPGVELHAVGLHSASGTHSSPAMGTAR